MILAGSVHVEMDLVVRGTANPRRAQGSVEVEWGCEVMGDVT